MPHTFVINDQTKKNAHGFKTLNSGIDMNRFRSNPVILDYHNPTNQNVIGRWTNIRTEGDKLLADAEFDNEDPNAKLIEGKIERGFIKGSSMGIKPIGSEPFKLDFEGVPTLQKSELMEASIVAIPSNANAIKLYAEAGIEMSAVEIKLALSTEEFKPETNPKSNKMHKINLSIIALAALSMSTTEATAENIAPAVEDLAKRFNEQNAELTALKAKVESQLKSNAETLIEQAVTDGKLTADLKESWTKMAIADFETINKTVSAMKGTTSLAAQVANSDKSEVKTADDFEKLSDVEKLAFKNSKPEEYNKIFA